jgi:hypothetical protein
MKRNLIVGGSILAVVLIVLVTFTSIAFAQSTNPNPDSETPIIKQLRERLVENEWRPGYYIAFIILFLLFVIEGITSGPNPI